MGAYRFVKMAAATFHTTLHNSLFLKNLTQVIVLLWNTAKHATIHERKISQSNRQIIESAAAAAAASAASAPSENKTQFAYYYFCLMHELLKIGLLRMFQVLFLYSSSNRISSSSTGFI